MYYIVYKNYSSRPQETWKKCTTIKKLNYNNAAINTIFNSWLKVIFSLYGIVTYGNDFQQRKRKLKPGIKLNPKKNEEI